MSSFEQGSFTVEDIRPEALQAEQQARFEADIGRLLEFAHDFVETPCPACQSDDRVPAFEKYGFGYVVCGRCQTMYVNPRPRPQHLERYYSTSENYQFWAQHIFPATEDARRERIFRPRVERVLEICRTHGVPTGSLVEVGPGFGTFCELVAQSGAFEHVRAVEPTPSLAAHCRERGIHVIEKRVEDLTSDDVDGVDVVASFEVVEHLFDPGSFIEACGRFLRPGGLLVLTCPNGRGFDISVLGPESEAVDPEHLNYFNPESLTGLVERLGFAVVDVSTPGRLDAELVRQKALDGRWDARSSPFLHRVLVEEWDRLGQPFQQFLADNRLSSHMWLVARR